MHTLKHARICTYGHEHMIHASRQTDTDTYYMCMDTNTQRHTLWSHRKCDLTKWSESCSCTVMDMQTFTNALKMHTRACTSKCLFLKACTEKWTRYKSKHAYTHIHRYLSMVHGRASKNVKVPNILSANRFGPKRSVIYVRVNNVCMCE